MENLHILAKGGLIVLILFGLAVLVQRLTYVGQPSVIPDPGIPVLEIGTTLLPDIDIFKNVEKCMAHHFEYSFLYISPLKNVTASSCHLPPALCMHQMLISFSDIMESFGIKLQLIEPSFLFCMLPSAKKFNLLTRGFSSIKVQGSRNVVTLGILPTEAKMLDEAHVRWKLIAAGYKILRFPNEVKPGLINGNESNPQALHYFIIKNNIVIHLIVFYPRKAYLWSPNFNSVGISIEGLQFVNNSAFEKFTLSPVYLSTLSVARLYIPSDARSFLLDMMSSNFLECKINATVVSFASSDEQMALKELKVILASQMAIFWLWSKSLQGWLEKCNVLHHSPHLNVAVAAKSVEGYNFSALFTNSKCQHMDNLSNLGTIVKIELKCYGVSINVFLMYEDDNTYWYEHFDGQNTYKLSFPKFTLCSTDVFGMKINVPCETSELLKSNYGQFLKNTTLYLNPQSMKNVVLESNN